MLLRLTSVAAAVVINTTRIHHRFFAGAAISNLRKPFAKIPWRYRSKAIRESQKALLEYLHITRSVPFLYADYIAKNSPHCLWEIASKIPFSHSTFAHSLKRFLRYHPINELDFLQESIGLSCDDNCISISLLPPNTLFLSDWKHFDVICALAGMGFPWSKLGLLCKEERSILETDPQQLIRNVSEIKDAYGFNSVCVISICLAFPQVLCGYLDGLLDDLNILFLVNNFLSCVDGNVNDVLEVCEKIKLFYDTGCEMGRVGDLMGRSKNIFIEYSKEELLNKIEFFSELKVHKGQVGLLLLSRPEIFSFNLEDRVISVKGFLRHFGMGEKEITSFEQKYPHVFGRNKIANLPRVMRAMNLGEWFFEMMQNGDPSLLNTYSILCKEDLDKHYAEGLTEILAKRTNAYRITKLNFLHSIGIGENRFAVKALHQLHSNRDELQQRFNYLLQSGIEYSRLCALLAFTARVLNQKQSYLQEKVEYLCTEMGLSLQFLDVFPGYLCHDLENRIKPRYRFHEWLKEQGYCGKDYAIATIIASSEKTFLARISRFDDAARKWQEISLR